MLIEKSNSPMSPRKNMQSLKSIDENLFQFANAFKLKNINWIFFLYKFYKKIINLITNGGFRILKFGIK